MVKHRIYKHDGVWWVAARAPDGDEAHLNLLVADEATARAVLRKLNNTPIGETPVAEQVGSDDVFLTPSDVRRRFAVNPHTLRTWRKRGGGPPFHRLGPRTIRYRLRDVVEWMERSRVGGAR